MGHTGEKGRGARKKKTQKGETRLGKTGSFLGSEGGKDEPSDHMGRGVIFRNQTPGQRSWS